MDVLTTNPSTDRVGTMATEVRPDRTKSVDRLRSLQYPLRQLNIPAIRRVSSEGSPYLSFTLHSEGHSPRSWRIYYRKSTKSYLLHADGHGAPSQEFKGGAAHVANQIVNMFRSKI